MRLLHPKRMFNVIRKRLQIRKRIKERIAAVTIVEMEYGGFWRLREKFILGQINLKQLYWDYCESNCSYIGEKAKFSGEPVFPHGICGVFVSNSAIIGKNVTIFQHVTIGSNMLKNTSHPGAPIIGDNCVLGAGCVIVGGIIIGDNCRIGAGSVVWYDVPSNSTVVCRDNRCIQHDFILDNTFVPNH